MFILLCGCAREHQKPTKPLSHQGIEAAAVLGRFLSPTAWNEARRASLIQSIVPLEYHGATAFAKTLVHAKFEIPENSLQALLSDAEAGSTSFESDSDPGHAFGPDSHHTWDSDGSGAPRVLSWWQPGTTARKRNYFWASNLDNKPVTRIWLQAAERDHGSRLVYVRIEIE
jgi:hypothetical protein